MEKEKHYGHDGYAAMLDAEKLPDGRVYEIIDDVNDASCFVISDGELLVAPPLTKRLAWSKLAKMEGE